MARIPGPSAPRHPRARKTMRTPKRPRLDFGRHTKLGKKGKDGVLFSWAGNIAHLETAYKSLPKLQKLKGVSLERTPAIERLEKDFESLRPEGIADLLKDPNFLVIEDSERRLVHQFTLGKLTGRRFKFRKLDFTGHKPYDNTDIDLEVLGKIDKKAIPPPSSKLIHYVMAKELGEKGVPETRKGRCSKKKLRKAWTKALAYLDDNRLDRAATESEMLRALETNKELRETLAEVKEHTKFRGDAFQQAYRDEIAANDDTILERVDEDIVLDVDMNDQIIVVSVSKMFQMLFPDETVSDVAEAFRLWSYHQGLPNPEHDGRHALQRKFLRDHPEFDVTKAADFHHACSCIEHYGCHCTTGDPHGDKRGVLMTMGSLLNRHRFPYKISPLYNAIRDGAFVVVTDVAKFGFRALFPKLYGEYIEVQQNTDKDVRMDTREEEPFTLRAFLTGVTTGDHIDSSDWHQGIAALVSFGEYKGARMLLRQLGQNIAYPSGTLFIIRGHELAHSTTDWEGKSRYCVVHASHEAVRRIALRKMGRPPPSSEYQQDHCIARRARDDEERDREFYDETSDSDSYEVESSDTDSDESELEWEDEKSESDDEEPEQKKVRT